MIAAQRVFEDTQQLPSLEDAKQYIYSIDFTMIINKMVSQGWSRQVAEELSLEYKNFLFLNKKYLKECSKPLPPSEEVDEFWHNHVLDTIKYRQDCQHIFGYYFDHYPYFGIDDKTNHHDLNKAFEKTLQFYLIEFGKEMPKITHRFTAMTNFIRRTFKKKI